MGTFVELRCENDTKQCSKAGIHAGLLAYDTRASVLFTLRLIETKARENGWRKTKERWLCAHCAKSMSDSAS